MSSSSQSELSSSRTIGGPSSSQPKCPWLSHARRPHLEPSDSTTIPKKGRGTLKGLKVAKKASESSTGKLDIEFSKKYGGPICEFRRLFVDDVVVQTRHHASVVGIKKWSEVSLEIQNSIKDKVLQKWNLDDNDENRTKILKISRERYRGWRARLSATYKAYKGDYETLLRNKPEELDLEEWKHLIQYFQSDVFQIMSNRNSQNRSKQQTKHICGSKSFSQVSYENRDLERHEEPSDIELWFLTHCKKEEWSDNISKNIYEEVNQMIIDMEVTEGRVLSIEERDKIFQSVVGYSSGHVRGRGYMAKPSTSVEGIRAELCAELRVERDEIQRQSDVLNSQVQELQRLLEKERGERERQLVIIQQKMREEFMELLARHSQGATYEGI